MSVSNEFHNQVFYMAVDGENVPLKKELCEKVLGEFIPGQFSDEEGIQENLLENEQFKEILEINSKELLQVVLTCLEQIHEKLKFDRNTFTLDLSNILKPINHDELKQLILEIFIKYFCKKMPKLVEKIDLSGNGLRYAYINKDWLPENFKNLTLSRNGFRETNIFLITKGRSMFLVVSVDDFHDFSNSTVLSKFFRNSSNKVR